MRPSPPQLAVSSADTATELLARKLTSTAAPDAWRRAGLHATFFDILGIEVHLRTVQGPLELAMEDDAGRRGVADVMVQLVDELLDTDADRTPAAVAPAALAPCWAGHAGRRGPAGFRRP